MGIEENWQNFINITKSKSKSHMQASLYWDRWNHFFSLSLILLGAVTTFFSLIDDIPGFVVSSVAALTTLFSAITAYMRPHDRRQIQTEAAKDFKVLMMRMVRCEVEADYENLWNDLNHLLSEEPFLPKKFTSHDVDFDWTMTPELRLVAMEKRQEVEKMSDDMRSEASGSSSNHSNDCNQNKSMGKGETMLEMGEKEGLLRDEGDTVM